MAWKSLMVAASLAAVTLAAAPPPAVAQQTTPIAGPSEASPPETTISGRPRIEINPRPLFRRCTSWYVVQYRPSGRVLFPEKHCWWVRG